MAESLNYFEKANIKLEFRTTSMTGTDSLYYNLCGFLGEEGLTFSLKNGFENSLALAGSIFTQLQELGVGIRAAVEGVTQEINKNTKPGTAIAALTGALKGMNKTKGYVSLGGGGQNIILNAPYYWQGTEPITFNITLYQIADKEEDILESYQRVLEILSPSFNSEGTASVSGGQNNEVVGYGEGPGFVMLHYFPVDGSWGQNGNGTGTIVIGPCLCRNVTMEIKAPYSSSYMPIIGSYKFEMLSSRLLDRSVINNIFRGTKGPLFPKMPAAAGGGEWVLLPPHTEEPTE